MLSESYYKECEKVMDELSALGWQGDMWAEAQSQCLQSWLECGGEYTDEQFMNSIMDDLEYKTEAWLRGQLDNCSDEELAEGGCYHWMVQAMASC